MNSAKKIRSPRGLQAAVGWNRRASPGETAVTALAGRFGDPGYELVLHTAPNLRSRILQGDWATIRDDYHWHLEILAEPERTNRVGGIYVNETAPEATAAELRRALDGVS